jgi:hypothetical protein
VWAQPTPPIEPIINVVNEGPKWWVTVLAGALPAVAGIAAALIAVFFEGRRQRRQFAEELRHERERWADQQRVEREGFWRERRQGIYTAMLVALSRVERIGPEVAAWLRHNPQEHRDYLGRTGMLPEPVKPWVDASDDLRQAVMHAVLVASAELRGAAIACLTIIVTNPPTADPQDWLHSKSDPKSAPIASELASLRQELERLARTELGVDEQVTPATIH